MKIPLWKKIKDYENYEISLCGDVMNHRGKLLIPSVNEKGYLYITLSNELGKKTFKIHRLVALHYVKNPKNKPQAHHKDEDKQNNYYYNLEWTTNKENSIAYCEGKLFKKYKKNKILQIETGIVFKTIAAASKAVDRHQASIKECCQGLRKTCGGYSWQYYESKNRS